jgi:hypothetical protein
VAQVLDLLDVRVTIVEHQKRTAGHRVLSPAKVRIEGVVTDGLLAQVSESTRDIDEVTRR